MAGRIAYYGNIVTNGLVLDLDAAKRDSYPGSGTAWNDISGFQNNGTLTNGPTYSTSGAGSIVFDGVNDYVNCGNPTNLQLTTGTISCWAKGQQQGSDYNGIVVKNGAWGIFIFQSTLRLYDWGNNTGRNTGINISDNIWRHITLTFTSTLGTPNNNAIIYINGVAVLTTTIKNSSQSSSLLLGYGDFGTQYLNGSIATTQIYNRALSDAEILQNYNATKTRYQ